MYTVRRHMHTDNYISVVDRVNIWRLAVASYIYELIIDIMLTTS